ncbi:heavy-metal-associated domain-containing protein [Lutimonas sp.]|uniref:heavy-metal-associated domain-containing protein n=1 Tax=Lutimonas sp. TaxID=1872403 RepID=UPI003D9AFDAF
MKVHIKFISLVIIVLFFVSCDSKKESQSEQSDEQEKELVAEDIQQVKVDIKGMTCEIGCARLIQSKLYKADGVTFAKVSFADSSGVVSFDQNRISQKEIKQIIEGTAGGEIYSVASIENIKEASENIDVH